MFVLQLEYLEAREKKNNDCAQIQLLNISSYGKISHQILVLC